MKRELSEKKTGRYYLLYTALFSLTCFLAYFYLIRHGKTMIWQSDGFQQHYTAFAYYGNYLREILRGLLHEHRLIIRSFDFTLGEGSDVIQALSYYVVGDPFAALAVFFTAENAAFGFQLSVILRMYCAGAAFSFLCREREKGSFSAVLAGALCYSFCYWSLLNSCRHPFFINPLIWLPLVICGVERILAGRRPYLYLAAVCLMALSNFYYFYMLVLLTVIYVVSRLLYLYRRDARAGFRMLLKIAGFSVMATAIAGVLLLPVLRFFLIDNRNGIETRFELLYPIKYYSYLPAFFLAPRNYKWVLMGFAVPSFFTLCLLFRRRERRGLIFYLLLSLVFLLFPFFGQVFNGLSYCANRWCFAIALMVSYSLTLYFDALAELDGRELRYLFFCLAAYALACLLLSYARSLGQDLLLPLLGAAVFYAALVLANWGRKTLRIPVKAVRGMYLSAVIVSIFLNGLLVFAPRWQNYADVLLTQDDIDRAAAEETGALLAASGEDPSADPFFRICGPDSTWNQGTLAGLPYMSYFWSVSSPYQADFWNELGISEYLPYDVRNYNYRGALLSLSSVKYLTSLGECRYTPEGFAALPAPEGAQWRIYENANALPLGYCYDSAISTEAWRQLEPLAKQETMLQDAVLDAPPTGFESDAVITAEPIDYTIAEADEAITLEEGGVLVTAPNAYLRLSFAPQESGEFYLRTAGVRYMDYTEYDLYNDDERIDPQNQYGREEWKRLSAGQKRELLREQAYHIPPSSVSLKLTLAGSAAPALTVYTRQYNQYNGREDFLNNLGTADGANTMEIRFSRVGFYSFDSLELFHQPTQAYAAQIEALRRDTLENVQFGVNRVSGSISLDEPRILCLAIPWSEGWTAAVDGEEAPLMQANVRHMALALDAGEHEILLKYHTPLSGAGALLSLAGLAALAAYALRERRHGTKAVISENTKT